MDTSVIIRILFLIATLGSVSSDNSGQCALENNTDFNHHDIGRGSATTVAGCCAECSRTPGCTSFTVWLGGPACYLKNSTAGRRQISDHVSGTVPHPLPPTPPPPNPQDLVNTTDCLMRSFFLKFAAQVNPNLSTQHAELMADALAGDPIMGSGCHIIHPAGLDKRYDRSFDPLHGSDVVFWVDAVHGSDSAVGSRASPFQSVVRAVTAVRSAGRGGVVNLRAGVFHFNSTLFLTAADSGILIQTDPLDLPQQAWLSGSVPLLGPGAWKPINTTGANIWAIDLRGTSIDRVPGLRWQGRRLWSARFPNGDPETSRPFKADITAHSWLPSKFQHLPPVVRLAAPSSTDRNDTLTDTSYTMYTGGSACYKYTPPISHYCGRGGGMDAGGGTVIDDNMLPNAPYANASGAVITAMHGGLWCSFSYKVDESVHSNGATTFTFSEGGQQCNRPEASHGQLLVEGVIEELDSVGEYYFNETTKTLTLWHNATPGTPPPLDGSLAVLKLKTLINATGSPADPVKSVSLLNLGFRDTAPTLFSPHVAPTGGDWAVNREAAITVAGTEDLNISHSTFERLDNAGVFLGGYNRRLVIADNDFAWLGESAVVSVGDTAGGGDFANFSGFGWDGTAGNQPRNSRILRNFARELGILNKQSAFYFQAATSNSTVEGNIIFNGARSGINFNDCFGTGSVVRNNVMFNLNRETADHGCFNSWDRLPFIPSKSASNRDLISSNLILSNFNSYNGIDTDDDSAYFHMFRNVLLYGHVLKSDFSGHDIEYEQDLGIFTDQSNQYQQVPSSHRNSLHDCTLFSAKDGDVLFGLTPQTCNGTFDDFPKVYDVIVHTPSAQVTVCRQPVATMEKQGLLHNITVFNLTGVSSSDILDAAHQTLLGDTADIEY